MTKESPKIMILCSDDGVAQALGAGLSSYGTVDFFDFNALNHVNDSPYDYYDVWLVYNPQNAPFINQTIHDVLKVYKALGTKVFELGNQLSNHGNFGEDAVDDGVHTMAVPCSIRDIISDIRNSQNKWIKYKNPLPLAGNFFVHVNDNTVQKEGIVLSLTEKEIQILVFLAQRGEKGATREQILGHVWGQDDPLNSHTLETHMSSIRAKFGKTFSVENIIGLNGKIYRL